MPLVYDMFMLVRRATAAGWTSLNPILQQGELGWEIDTNKLKIGDGTTAWTTLTYFGTVSEEGLTLGKALAATAYYPMP